MASGQQLSVNEYAVPLQHLHEHVVRGSEIVELLVQLVLLLHSVEEVIAEAEHDDEQGGHAAAWVVVAAVDHGAHHGLSVRISEMQMVEVIGEFAICVIALPEVGELSVERLSVERAAILRPIDRVADRLGVSLRIEVATLEQAPE